LRGRVRPAPARRAGSRPRFEQTDRWARGRVVAALAAGERLPAELAPDRLERVLVGLERDGLVRRGATGVGLPDEPR
jgi:A/G-specific adenine glycosylase